MVGFLRNVETTIARLMPGKIVKTCSAGYVLQKTSRGRAHKALEGTGEVSLVIETNGQTNVGQIGLVCGLNQLLSPLYLILQDVLVRRVTEGLLKKSSKVVGAKVHLGCQDAQAQVIPEMLMNIFDHASEIPRRKPARRLM
jgi:hypothetical protein